MIRWLSCGLLLIAVLSACGDDGPEPSGSSLAITTNADVAELLGTPFSDQDVRAEFQSIHARSEGLIAECMVDAGFDYVPAPFQESAGQPVLVTETSLGIADQFFGAFSADFEAPPINPNAAIVEALSDDERSAYNQALQGGSPAVDVRFETAETIRDGLDAQVSVQGGCQFESQRAALAETDRNQNLIDDYTTLRTGMFQIDQRLLRARFEWAQCMAEAGFTYRDEAAMTDDLNGQAVAVLQDLVALRDDGVEMVPQQEPPAEAAALIDELREREAKLAAAHAGCRESTDVAIAEVRAEVDEIFLERNS